MHYYIQKNVTCIMLTMKYETRVPNDEKTAITCTVYKY